MNPKLSVIIPVYKVEDYLERCVKSVVSQDYRDLEVILVDDGSPDNCPQICDKLAKTDDRIVVIHKSNGGLSSARNAGIEQSRGEYLAFLDSDDQWAEGKLKQLMESVIAAKVDMVMFHGLSLYPDGTIMSRDYSNAIKGKYHVYSSVDLYKILIEGGNFWEQAGTHIVSSKFIKDNKIFFSPGLLGEDTEWMFRVMRIIKKVAVADNNLLLYSERRPGSITNSITAKNLRDLITIIQASIDFYSENPSLEVRPYELAQCAYLWSTALGRYSVIPVSERQCFKDKLKSLLKNLDLNSHPKSKLVGRVYKVLGFSLTSRLLELYIKLHRRNLINGKTKVNG